MKKVVIKKEDLKHNINAIKEYAKTEGEKVTIIAVVKANGYGMGIVEYTNFLIDNGVEFFAVATLEEALTLRKAGIKEKILMLSSTAIKEEVEQLVENNIIITLGSQEDIKIAEEVGSSKNKEIKAHLKIDTGFGRYGFIYTEPEKIVQAVENLKNIKIEGVYTHFSLAFYEKSKYTQTQFDRFIKVIEVLKLNNIELGMLHVCNSSAFIRFPMMHLNAVRVGSAFTGKLPFKEKLGLKPIGNLKAKVTEVKTLPKGFNVSYSNAYTTTRETKVAIIPCGYIDGVNMVKGEDMFRNVDKLRRLVGAIKGIFKKEAIYVKINGENCKVLGKVGTFHVTVDITGKDVKIGDTATFTTGVININPNIRREYI